MKMKMARFGCFCNVHGSPEGMENLISSEVLPPRNLDDLLCHTFPPKPAGKLPGYSPFSDSSFECDSSNLSTPFPLSTHHHYSKTVNNATKYSSRGRQYINSNSKKNQRRTPDIGDSLLEIFDMPNGTLASRNVERSKATDSTLLRQSIRPTLVEALHLAGISRSSSKIIIKGIPQTLESVLKDAKRQRFTAYSLGIIDLTLADQVMQVMETRGIMKTITFLYSLGVKASLIGPLLESFTSTPESIPGSTPDPLPLSLGRTESLFPHCVSLVHLLHSVGVRPSRVGAVLCRNSSLLTLSLDQIRGILNLLLSVGVQGSDLGKIIEMNPKILDPESQATIPQLVAYLSSLGVTPRGVSSIARRYPYIFQVSIRKRLMPAVEILRSRTGLTAEEVSKIVIRNPRLLACSIDNKIIPILDYFLNLVQPKGKAKKFLTNNPEVLALNLTNNVIPTVSYLESLGMSRERVGRMIGRNGNILRASVATVGQKLELLQSFGLTQSEAIRVIEYFPSMVSGSDVSIKAKHDFLVREMGLPSTEVVKFPMYFGYDLETRIRPRYQKLRSLGKSLCLNSMLSRSTKTFKENYGSF